MQGFWNKDDQPSIEELAALIREEQGIWGRIAPGLREAAAAAPFVDQKSFVAAAVLAGIHPSTAAIQFRKQREYQRLAWIESGEVSASPEEKAAASEQLNKWSW